MKKLNPSLCSIANDFVLKLSVPQSAKYTSSPLKGFVMYINAFTRT